MAGQQLVRRNSPQRTEQLAAANDHLASVLETIDLAHEERLADAVLTAVKATDRAYQLTTEE